MKGNGRARKRCDGKVWREARSVEEARGSGIRPTWQSFMYTVLLLYPKTTMCIPFLFIFYFTCMFYQLLRVQHSCSSTQSWGSVLPSIVKTRDQNSRGFPLLFCE